MLSTILIIAPSHMSPTAFWRCFFSFYASFCTVVCFAFTLTVLWGQLLLIMVCFVIHILMSDFFFLKIFWAEHYKEWHLAHFWLNINHCNHLVTVYKCKTYNMPVALMIWRASGCSVCSDYGEGSCPVSITPAVPSRSCSEWLSIHVWLKTDGTQSSHTVCKHLIKCHI